MKKAVSVISAAPPTSADITALLCERKGKVSLCSMRSPQSASLCMYMYVSAFSCRVCKP